MKKSESVFTVAMALTLLVAGSAYASDPELWERYKSGFLARDGRIVDFHQDKCSHSEGQGYGMLLAVSFNDRVVFDRIWKWTKDNLRARADGLFAWKWGERVDGRWEIIDQNNATDGDLLIAMALLRASEKWGDPAYKKEALPIIGSVRKGLVVERNGRILIMPSYYGFIKKDGLVFNPSYLILPAFRSFAKADDKAFWDKAAEDSLHFISKSLFGRYGLPADWAIIKPSGEVSLYEEKSAYFGHDAIRTLLHLAGEGAGAYPKGIADLLKTCDKLGYVPMWFDLDRDSMSMSPASAGVYAIYSLVARKLGQTSLADKLSKEAKEKLAKEELNYFSSSLYLLVASDAL